MKSSRRNGIFRTEVKECAECGKRFGTSNVEAKFCSHRCRARHYGPPILNIKPSVEEFVKKAKGGLT